MKCLLGFFIGIIIVETKFPKNEALLITTKRSEAQPYYFEILKGGHSKFVFRGQVIVPPESAFKYPNNREKMIELTYKEKVERTFVLDSNKIDSILSFAKVLSTGKIKKIQNSDSTGVFFEWKPTKQAKPIYIGKLGDAPIFQEMLCSMFGKYDTALPGGMLPYFQEEHGLSCGSEDE
jgi:hypothetical protein